MARKIQQEYVIKDKGSSQIKAAAGNVNNSLGSISKQSKSVTSSILSGWKTLALSIGSVFAIGIGVDFFKDITEAASDAQETTGKFNVVFKEVMDTATEMQKVLVDSYGLANVEAQKFLSSTQDLLKPLGIASKEAADLSGAVVRLAVDLGSFNNLNTDKVLADMQSALVGNFETMKKYGVVLNETVVKQEAMNSGLWDGKGSLDAATKAQAALNLIMKGSADAMGDFARTQDSFANQMKIFNSTVLDLKATLGEALLPILTPIVTQLTAWLKVNKELMSQKFEAWVKGTVSAVTFLTQNLDLLAAAITALIGLKLINLFKVISVDAGLAGAAMVVATGATDGLIAAQTILITQINTLIIVLNSYNATWGMFAVTMEAAALQAGKTTAAMMTTVPAAKAAKTAIGGLGSAVTSLSGFLIIAIGWTYLMQKAFDGLSKHIPNVNERIIDFASVVHDLEQDIIDLQTRIANPTAWDKLNNFFGKYDRDLKANKATLIKYKQILKEILLEQEKEARKLEMLNLLHKAQNRILDETQKKLRGKLDITGKGPSKAEVEANEVVIKIVREKADIVRDLERQITFEQANHVKKRALELKYWEQDQIRTLKASLKEKKIIQEDYNKAIGLLDNLVILKKANLAKEELRNQMILNSSFISLMEDFQIKYLDIKGKTFEAEKVSEEKRYRELVERLSREFSTHTDFLLLLEAARLEHVAKMNNIKVEEFAASAGNTKMTPAEQERRNALKAIEELEKIAKEQEEKFKEMVARVSDFFGERFGGMWSEWIAGTKTLKDSFKDMVRSMMDDLARMAASAAFKHIFNFFLSKMGSGSSAGGFFTEIGSFLGFAAGGQVAGGQPIMVGERGPEIFTPGNSGRINPNGGGASLTVVNNVTVEGGGGGGTQDQKRMGMNIAQMIATQTKMAIYNETRPGGILNAGSRRF